MKKTMRFVGGAATALLLLTACSSSDPKKAAEGTASTAGSSAAASPIPASSSGSSAADSTTSSSAAPSASEASTSAPKGSTGKHDPKFYNQAEYDKQLALRTVKAEGPAGKPWEQYLQPEMIDTAKYKKDGDIKLCFSNAGVGNPWRVTGYKSMQAEVEVQKIKNFVTLDAEGDDNKQISQLESLGSQKCSAIIVSPNSTGALTPAVEKACATNVPVIVFDRGVTTKCAVTFIHPIGGYAFGATGAEFLKEKVKPGGNILALRILPGVDVLENRWSAAKNIFDASELNVVGVEFTDGDPAKTKKLVTDYIAKNGGVQGVWMDAGATAVSAIEAFEDAGEKVPPIVGEDQQDFLKKWSDDKLTAVSPTYPTYQWRTPVIAAVKILKGEQVPKEWILPQPTITDTNLKGFVQGNMPATHYALCGCEDLPGYPKRWGG